jgi:ribosomal protein L2
VVQAPIRVGNTLPIRNIPVGSTIHCIEMQIGKVRKSPLRRHLRNAAGR